MYGAQIISPGIGGQGRSSLATSKRISGEITPSAFILSFNMEIMRASGGTDARWLGIPLRRQKYLRML